MINNVELYILYQYVFLFSAKRALHLDIWVISSIFSLSDSIWVCIPNFYVIVHQKINFTKKNSQVGTSQ